MSIDDVVDSYRTYLQLHQASHPGSLSLQFFDNRLNAAPYAARAEAVTFALLRSEKLNPRIEENPSTGGVDFRCDSFGTEFVVEVTALGPDAVTNRSGVDNEIRNGKGGGFSLITRTIRNRLIDKASQISNHSVASLIVIVSEHMISAALLGPGAAEEVMTGDLSIVVPIGPDGAGGDSFMSADPSEAAFFRPTPDGIELCRKNISAVLLVCLHGGGCEVVGLLHPQPAVPLDLTLFPEVPFVRMKWPLDENRVELEWIIKHPNPATFGLHSIQLTNEELKKGL